MDKNICCMVEQVKMKVKKEKGFPKVTTTHEVNSNRRVRDTFFPTS